MKQKFLFLALLAVLLITTGRAQVIVPDSYTAVHSDSCWYITMNYYVDEIPAKEQLLLTSTIYCPDTCVSDVTRCFRGNRFRPNGNAKVASLLSQPGMQRCRMVVPENMVADSLIAVTTCTIEKRDGTITENDSMYIYLPSVSPLSCHRVQNAETAADRVAYRHRCIYPMAYYQSLDANNIPSYRQSEYVVTYRPASHILENGYMGNSSVIDTLANLISSMVADSLAQIEVVQLVGYSSPENSERSSRDLGLRRARSLRDKLKYHCNLPDSVFEIIDGGRNWELIYESVGNGDVASGDTLVAVLRAEKAPARRETLLRGFMNGNVLRMLSDNALNAQRQACCARIYYRNNPDTVSPELNRVVNELMTNETPDYDSLRTELSKYSDDARAINLMGIIDYREHRRGAAKKAFSTAALMGDEQAMTNLLIITRDK
jgi:hypothetical protein